MTWLELSINTTHEAVDWVRTLLSLTDYTSVLEVTAYTGANPPDQRQEDEQSQWACTLSFYLPHNVQANAHLETIERLLSPLHRTGMISELKTIPIIEKGSVVEVSQSLVHRVGQRFVILDADADYSSKLSNEIPIRLQKTLSFGSGLHPTTMLSLRLLERYVNPAMHTLDLGCGSGILSVAIAKLGATVLAIDNDPVAVQATQDAVVRNGVEQQVTTMQGSLGQGSTMGHWMGLGTIEPVLAIDSSTPFALIVANILGRMHLALVQDYRSALEQTMKNTGLLITSGFTTDYENEINHALTEAGFEAIDCERVNEWAALVHRLND
ncbi:50S ribosomal protein L11 methyltransferase [Leptothermofonsia sp. ETS-13]|uniref:50S ribosomal protein L11 methyltransferase n=1 Tax=Leptothermofonsia sp. ETS-13 TaxID=3035696 RepID=UPI003B9FB701